MVASAEKLMPIKPTMSTFAGLQARLRHKDSHRRHIGPAGVVMRHSFSKRRGYLAMQTRRADARFPNP